MKLKKETYSIQAAEYIQNLIRSGHLAPGDPIKEAALSEKLHISRAPVREALLLLGQQGLIVSEPQKGKYVRALSASEIRDSYVVGGILEGAGVVQSIQRWTEKEEAAFAEVCRRLDEEINHATQLDTLTDIDEQFHMTLLSACPNSYLIHLARTSCSSLAKFLYYHYWRTLFTPKEFYDRHVIIIEAVKSRNPIRIEESLRQHYAEVGTLLSELVHENQKENNGN